MANEVVITKSNFKDEVLGSDIPVLVDFWAEWCMPCKMIAPILEGLSEEYAGKIKIGKLDVDSEGEIAEEYNIVSIPTLLLFKNGELVKEHVGTAPKPVIEALVKEVV